eukprot:TRINITY_DN3907_c0_g1_i1.p2 TRINITY_DN3907_c0_g1~~TRINITY_DN3907_c0_g1_i1.p2  ORF type:complete len:141 (+),score=24.75 TRINITY_DN3907_c0_g1_i1:1975-2397(+)
MKGDIEIATTRSDEGETIRQAIEPVAVRRTTTSTGEQVIDENSTKESEEKISVMTQYEQQTMESISFKEETISTSKNPENKETHYLLVTNSDRETPQIFISTEIQTEEETNPFLGKTKSNGKTTIISMKVDETANHQVLV